MNDQPEDPNRSERPEDHDTGGYDDPTADAVAPRDVPAQQAAPVEPPRSPYSAPQTADQTAYQPPQPPAHPGQSTYAPPTGGSVPPAFGRAPASPNGYGQPQQHPYAQQQPAPSQAQYVNGQQPAAVATSAEKSGKGRRAALPLIAALAVGALVGGVSAAAVTGIALSANESSQAPVSANPANVTVNDGADATLITAVAASAGPSVVTISVSDAASQGGGTGSGVILSEDGYILTNTHVVTLDGASATPAVSVQTSDGRLFQADVVGTDPISDLAVIKVQDGSGFQPAEFADSSKLNVGDTAVAIGAPLGLSNTVTNGIVSSLNRSITVASSAAPTTPEDRAPQDDQGSPFDFWQYGQEDQQQAPTQAQSTIALSVIQTDAAINPGNSGGALLDSEGKVIGINVAIASAGQGSGQSASGSIGVGFAIPSNLAKRISEEIIETGTGSHGLLGATVEEVDPSESSVVGAAIQDVSAGGAAQAAGLRAGDVITKVDDIPITNRTDLTAQIRALAAGSDATLTYVRNGDVATADVTLGDLG